MPTMETLNFNRVSKWKKRPTPNYRSPFLLFAFLTLCFFLLLFFFPRQFNSPSPIHTNPRSNPPPQCIPPSKLQFLGEKFLLYAPHSGFSNQLAEFKNALLISSILNRTLIIPPILDHHAVALGSCPKFRVLAPNDLRVSVWNHSIELISQCRYVSMADVIDISPLVSDSAVRVIDYRVFVSVWCGVDVDLACSDVPDAVSVLYERLKQCGSLLSGHYGNVNNCLYAVDEDCRTTVWVYQKDSEDGALDSFQPDEQLKRKKKISFVRKRRDIYKSLGPGSQAEIATVLAFGSLFTASYKGSESYIDIHDTPEDKRIHSLIKRIEFLPFVPEILLSGKEFALRRIRAPFLCAQLRLLDGQFKNHWESTFSRLKEKLDSLKLKGPLPVHVFVMTDLPMLNWTGSYLGDLAKDTDAFKLFVLKQEDELVVETTAKVANAVHGVMVGYFPENIDFHKKAYRPRQLPDILLFMEETICSCASLGFVGTAGSTIAQSIEMMRKFNLCSG